jgi:uncharacterized membrane protein
MEEVITEKRIFLAYEVGLIVKAFQAFLEIVAGMLLLAIHTNTIITFMLSLTYGELSEVPHSLVTNFLIKSADQFSVSGKFFIVFYLLSHGIIKLGIIIGLLLKKKWAYPASLIGFGGLLIYQLYSLIAHHSLALLIITGMDGIILWLIWREHIIEEHS